MVGEQSQAIESYLGWWTAAGLTDAVSDDIVDWLAPVAPSAARTAVAPPQPYRQEPASPAPVIARAGATDPGDAPPFDLSAFDEWLASSTGVPGHDWSMQRVIPSGPANAPLMLLADVPDPADIEAGRLFSGAQGRLVDAMLAAIGLTRDRCRIGSLGVTRPIGGRLDGDDGMQLLALARHHIAIARPHVLLLLGQQSAQLVAGDAISPQPKQHSLNHDGVTTAAFAIHHPRLLLERPLLKRPAWEVLKRVREQFDPS